MYATLLNMDEVKQVLDYCTSQEEAIITYHASDMVLTIHSDAGYLNKRKYQSQAGGHYYLTSNVPYPSNIAILNIAKLIGAVMSLAAKAELGVSSLMPRRQCICGSI